MKKLFGIFGLFVFIFVFFIFKIIFVFKPTKFINNTN